MSKRLSSSIRFHEMLKLCALACDQKLGCGMVKARALKLSDRRAEFENLGAQL